MILEELDDYIASVHPELHISLTGLPSEPPIRAVALIEQAGTAPIRLMASPLPVADHNRIQVRNRAIDYPDARADAYAVYAVVIYTRAAAERLGVQLDEITRQIAARHHLDLPTTAGRAEQHGEMPA